MRPSTTRRTASRLPTRCLRCRPSAGSLALQSRTLSSSARLPQTSTSQQTSMRRPWPSSWDRFPTCLASTSKACKVFPTRSCAWATTCPLRNLPSWRSHSASAQSQPPQASLATRSLHGRLQSPQPDSAPKRRLLQYRTQCPVSNRLLPMAAQNSSSLQPLRTCLLTSLCSRGRTARRRPCGPLSKDSRLSRTPMSPPLPLLRTWASQASVSSRRCLH